MLAPITDIPCNYECSAGQYFTIDTREGYRNYSCQECPKNTFSEGGGFSVNGDFGEWTQALKNGVLTKQGGLKMSCYKYSWFNWVEKDCTACSASQGGTSLECGTASAKETSVAFETSMRLLFVKSGKIEFSYRKDSVKEKDGFISGDFSFYLDDYSIFNDNSIHDDPNEWKHYSTQVQPGFHEIIFSYQKFNSAANKNMKFEIRNLFIQGTDHADYQCKKCVKGFSYSGADRCSPCPANGYLNPDTENCEQCPSGTYSIVGSISNSSNEVCKPKRNCTFEELPKKYSSICFEHSVDENEIQMLRNYTIDLTDFKLGETCVLDPTIQFSGIYNTSCGHCEGGNFLKKEPSDDGLYKCWKCPIDQATFVVPSTQCETCPAGKYLQKGLYLSVFEKFPSNFNFSTTCQAFNSSHQSLNPCSQSEGFEAKYLVGLEAGVRQLKNSLLTLSIDLWIVQDNEKQFNDASILMNFTTTAFQSEDKVTISLNNKENMVVNADGRNTYYVPLPLGQNKIKLVFEKMNHNSQILITGIKIVGTNVANGGALDCSQCTIGYVNEMDGSYSCSPCPIGSSSNSARTKCSKCGDRFYTPGPGSVCQECPENSYPSPDHQYCLPQMHLIKQNNQSQPLLYYFNFFQTNQLDKSSKISNVSKYYSLCKSQGAYCTNGFFGPVLSYVRKVESNLFLNEYYFSPLSKNDFSIISLLEIEQDEQESKSYTPLSYMIGLFDQTEVQHYSTLQVGSSEESTCGLSYLKGKNQNIVKSLGTNIQSIDINEAGFNITYNGGDTCFYQQNQANFTSEVRFICDQNEKEGWLQQVKSEVNGTVNQCHLVFEWRSKQACRQCLKSEVIRVNGQCDWEVREVSLNPSSTCIIYPQSILKSLLSINNFISDYESKKLEFNTITLEQCNPIEDFVKSQTFIYIMAALIVVLTLLFFTCSCVCCKYRKLQNKYYDRVNLIQSKKGIRNEPSHINILGMSIRWPGANMTYKEDSHRSN